MFLICLVIILFNLFYYYFFRGLRCVNSGLSSFLERAHFFGSLTHFSRRSASLTKSITPTRGTKTDTSPAMAVAADLGLSPGFSMVIDLSLQG